MNNTLSSPALTDPKPIAENAYRFYFQHGEWPANRDALLAFSTKRNDGEVALFSVIEFSELESGGLKISYSRPETLPVQISLDKPQVLSGDEREELIRRGRDRILQSPGLDEATRAAIKGTTPQVRFYLVPPKWTYFELVWPMIPTGALALVGEGDHLALDQARVELRK